MNASGGPWTRLLDEHALNAGTSATRVGVAPLGRGKPVTSARRADCTRRLVPSERVQTATPFTSTFGPAATFGSKPSCPAADTVVIGPNTPPAPGLRTEVWTRRFVPSVRCQPTSAFPALSIDTSGAVASAPTSDTPTGAPNEPPAGRYAAVMRSSPFDCVQATTALPEASTASDGPEALTPGSETVWGTDQLPVGVRLAD